MGKLTQVMADTPETPEVPTTEEAPKVLPPEEFDALQDDSEKYGSPTEMLKTAVEQGVSGATLGASKVLETQGIPALGIPAMTTPEAIAGREAENPITSTLSNIGGTAAMLYGTGGLGALAGPLGLAGRVGIGALEGAGIAGGNQATDDWSQNKALDGQKIAASAGLGSLLGAGGAALGEAISGGFKAKPLAEVPSPLSTQSELATSAATDAAAPPVAIPETKGVKPTSFQQIVDRVKDAQENGNAIPLPAQGELNDAASRIEMANPVNPLQRDALGSNQANEIYKTAKETPGEIGPILNNHEALQKNELVGKTNQTISDLSPGIETTSDAAKGGKYAVDQFTNQYQNEKSALSPIFQAFKKLPAQGDIVPDAVAQMTKAVPGISGMFDLSGGEIAVRPTYSTAWGIDKATYNAAKEAVQSLQEVKNPDLQTLWNVRKGLDQHVDVTAQGQASQEIRNMKAALMDQMQDASGDPTIRDAFKRYAINEQNRQVIEKSFGASVGSPEFTKISNVKPELIGDKIFGNTATTQAAKTILPKEQFNAILSNWLSENTAKVTDNAKNGFSSNKFANFLKGNQDALNVAFQDQPEGLQRLKDLSTIMRILPDAVSNNPSGTAKSLSRMIMGMNVHNLTWEGMLASIPKKIFEEIDKHIKMSDLNLQLSGQAVRNAQTQSLKGRVSDMSGKLDRGVKSLFSGSASQARKAQ